MKWLKISIISSVSFSVVFSIFSLLFYFGDWNRLFVIAIFGVFIGLLAAPEFDKKEFKMPTLFQVFCGAIAGGIAANYFTTDTEIIIFSFIIGSILGWLTPFWLKYVQIP